MDINIVDLAAQYGVLGSLLFLFMYWLVRQYLPEHQQQHPQCHHQHHGPYLVRPYLFPHTWAVLAYLKLTLGASLSSAPVTSKNSPFLKPKIPATMLEGAI